MDKPRAFDKVLVIGAGPTVIGQAAFDDAATQTVLALKQAGVEVVVVNANPATLMTDKSVADRVYIEPLTREFVAQILRKERPDALLATVGGQSGLTLAMDLATAGLLDELEITLLGPSLDAIDQTEDQEHFKHLMQNLNQPVLESTSVHSVKAAQTFASGIGYPVRVRPAFTMGNTGGGIAHSDAELATITQTGLDLSPVGQVLIERAIGGFKAIEVEVVRDHADNAMVVGTTENFDPVGVHSGDAIVFTPAQTLTDKEVQMLRDTALAIVRALKIVGNCNLQFALDPHSFHYDVLAVNPRFTRTSALVSKACGYPLAQVATQLVLGARLDTVVDLAGQPQAAVPPRMTHVAVRLPRFPSGQGQEEQEERALGTQMKATGAVMGIGRTAEEALLKGVHSLDSGAPHLWREDDTETDWANQIKMPNDKRLFAITAAFRHSATITELAEWSGINPFFLDKLKHIVELERTLAERKGDITALMEAKRAGFDDVAVARLWGLTPKQVRDLRQANAVVPVYHQIQAGTNAGFYSTYETENESHRDNRASILVLGPGPTRGGQGVEFDYATMHAVKAIQQAGYRAVLINTNPETVATEASLVDKLYIEPLTLEAVLAVIDLEQPEGVIGQFGGPTALNLTQSLSALGVPILGSPVADIAVSKERKAFADLIARLGLRLPLGAVAASQRDATAIAQKFGYPLVVRTDAGLGGQVLAIVNDASELTGYSAQVDALTARPVLIERYLEGVEGEVDLVADGDTVVLPGIIEHIERTGGHSDDTMAVYPAQTLSQAVQEEVTAVAIQLARALHCVGLMNLQFIVHKERVTVLAVNLRASRTMPFLSKVTGVPMADLATQVLLGRQLKTLGYNTGRLPAASGVHVKAPVFSFSQRAPQTRLLGPEMRATGEVMGSDLTMEKALYKAFEASHTHLPSYGAALFTVADNDKAEAAKLARRFHELGYQIVATTKTAAAFETARIPVTRIDKLAADGHGPIITALEKGALQLVVNTTNHDLATTSAGDRIRQTAIMYGVPLMTNLDTAAALLRVLESRAFTTTAR